MMPFPQNYAIIKQNTSPAAGMKGASHASATVSASASAVMYYALYALYPEEDFCKKECE